MSSTVQYNTSFELQNEKLSRPDRSTRIEAMIIENLVLTE